MRLLLVLLLAASFNFGSAEDIKAGPKIAVLRLEEVIRSCKQYSSRIDSLSQEQTDAKKTLKDMDDQLQQLGNQLQVLAKTNDRYAKVQEDFEVLKLKQKLFAERMQNSIERRHVAIIKETYAVLRQLLKEYSKEHGLQLVHLAPNSELKAPSMMEVQLELGLQSVLFVDDSLDITNDFISFANARFATSKSVDATPAIAPAGPSSGK